MDGGAQCGSQIGVRLMDDRTILTVVGGALVAAITGFFSWMAGSRKATADVNASVFQGFQGLINQMQEEMTSMRTEISELRQHVSAMEKVLREHGLPVPPRGKGNGQSRNQAA